VLAWAVSGSDFLAALDDGLLLPAGDAPAQLPWDLILRASWEPDRAEIVYQPSVGESPRSLTVPVSGEFEVLAAVVREQVMGSIVIQHHVELAGEIGARLIARRVPGETELRWSVVFDAGIDTKNPLIREQVDAVLTSLRSSLGV
jgi:hypothetical protein